MIFAKGDVVRPRSDSVLDEGVYTVLGFRDPDPGEREGCVTLRIHGSDWFVRVSHVQLVRRLQ